MTMLLILFVALQIADAVTTRYGILNGLKESNGIARFLFEKLGLSGGLFVAKVPITAIVVYIVLNELVGMTFMLLLVVPFVALLANNLYWINKAKG